MNEDGGIWYGTSGQIAELENDEFRDVPGDGYDMRTFDLTQEEHDGYYLGYANSVLWPLCHRRADLMALNAGDFETYMGVNRRLARMMAEHLQPDDMVWIHDYHFLPLAACLRDEGVEATLGYFHHIPFPAVHDLMALPEHGIFPEWISSFDLVGLQTQRDVAAALEMYRGLVGAEHLRVGRCSTATVISKFAVFPLGSTSNPLVKWRAVRTGGNY
nr:trehalose-6-phosphate synthase [Loktanella sp. M215]